MRAYVYELEDGGYEDDRDRDAEYTSIFNNPILSLALYINLLYVHVSRC
jgi:hypothetical protein